jgi:hypothetical protein
MQVLVLSLPKTGTVTMQAALDTLGYNTAHGLTWLFETEKHARGERAIDAKFYGIGEPINLAQWDDLTAEYSALTDVPCCAFADELISMYPEAKVILIYRDKDNWVKSAETMIDCMDYLPAKLLTKLIEPLKAAPASGAESSRPAILMLKLFGAYFGGQNSKELKANLRRTYRRHNSHVKELLQNQPDRFLEYKLGDGWDVLCKFLGKEVPVNTPFPHLNEGEMFKKMMYQLQMRFLRQAFDPVKANAVPLLAMAGICCAWVFMSWI